MEFSIYGFGLKKFSAYTKAIRKIIQGTTNTIDAKWFYDVDINEYFEIIFKKEKEHGRAIKITQLNEENFKLTFAH